MKNKVLKNIKTIASYVLALSVVAFNFGFVPITHATGHTLTIGSQTAVHDNVITVPITASITNIRGIQFSVNYPESILEYIPLGCSSTHVVCASDVGTSTNKINLTWYDVVTPMTLNNENLLSLQFKVLSSDASNTVLSFTPVVIINSSDLDVTGSTTFNSGTLTLNPASTVATVTSGTYTVSSGGTVNETITNVPFGTSKATFLVALSRGQVNQTWNDAGINNPVVTGNTLVVTAQDGTTVVTYTVTVNANSDIAIAQVVTDQITALPAVADLTLPGTAVTSARTAYNTLTSGQKSLVTNLTTLTNAEAQITALTSATTAVTNLETAIGLDLTVEVNLTDAESKLTVAYSTFTSVIAGGAKTDLANRFNTASGTVATAAVAADKAALVDDSIKGTNADLSHITVALTNPLPAGSHAGISWASSDISVVSNDGQTINRPTYAGGDTTITLTASIGKGITMICDFGGGNGGNGGGGGGGCGGATGTTKIFTLTVLKLSASAVATITSATYTVSSGGTTSETITNVPYGTNKTAFLIALAKGQTDQTWNDAGITDPVLYGNTLVVTAQDGTTVVTYTVTVNAAPVTLSSIAITHPANKLSYFVDETLDITGLEVTGHYSNDSTQIETIAPSDVSGFNSSTPVTGQVLTITVGGKTATYTVNVVAPLSSAKDITSFSFAQGVGVITGTNIAVTVPFSTVVTALVPTIVLSGGTVSPLSGVAQNFTGPVTYTVTAADSSTKVYTVTVTVAAPADISALTTAKGIAQGLIDAHATESTTPGSHIIGSLATLTTALSAANATEASSQSVVNGQVATLNSAISAYNLAIVPLSNMSAYDAALASKVQANYTIVTWDAYQVVVLANVVTSQNTQAEVDAATLAIITAQGSLMAKAGLEAYTAALAAVHEVNYTTASWTIYQGVVNANVVTDQDTQEAVTLATSNITAAQANLVAIAVMTAYNTALSAVTEADYTPASWATYQGVVLANVVTDQNTQEAVTLATSNITTAQTALIHIADLTALSAAIVSAQSLHNGATEGTAVGEYVVGSKAILKSAIDAALLVTSAEAQSVVNTAVTTLNSAVAVFSTQMIVGISSESNEAPSTNSITITWTTTHPATSRVVYDTVSHNPVTDSAPNYGYANSTTEDATLVTNHSVTVNSLSPSTTYFFRSVSHGSPETYGNEVSVATTATPPSGGGGGYTPPADTTPPSNTSVSINAGAATTSSLSSTLTLAATDATQMIVSNDAGFAGASWESYATSKTWTLTSGDGVKTVYAKFRDAAGNMSVATSDTITVSGTGTVAVVTNEPTQGCSAGNLYNTLTGSLCVNNAGPQIPGCGNRTTGFSTATGQSCATNRVGQVLGVEHFNFTKLMKNGSKGNEVIELQKFLTVLGYTLTADGKFGAKTKGAVIKFQVANKLKGDGVVGALTRAVLNK